MVICYWNVAADRALILGIVPGAVLVPSGSKRRSFVSCIYLPCVIQVEILRPLSSPPLFHIYGAIIIPFRGQQIISSPKIL
jgi:hypothetical protein